MKTNNFSKLSWEPCEFFHNDACAYTKRCIIGVPVYKSKLKDTEKASLNQLCKIIGHSYEICLICPKNIELNEYINIAYSNNVYLSFLFCSNDYFKSTETYSYMLETSDFYKCFSQYDYLMIYQLDGWILANFLDYYINLNVDYIGSPWKAYILGLNEDTVGNGGVSLRKVQKFIDVCNNLKLEDYSLPNVENEDLFFCKTLRNRINLKFADIKNASNFSLQSEWHYFIQKYNNGHLPMCMHAWDKDNEYKLLKSYIKIEYNESKHLSNDIITYNNLTKYQKFKSVIISNNKESIDKKELRITNKPQQHIQQNTHYNWSTYFNSYYNKVKKQEKESQNDENEQIIIKNNVQHIYDSLNTFYNIQSDVIKYICELEENEIFNTEISTNERIIVTLTTWPPRINNIHFIIERLMKNTLQPDIININVSIEEFPNKEKDFPIELQNDIKINSKINIIWLKHNTTVWKKLIPTLYKYPNDAVIPIDDDFVYPLDFIKTIYSTYLLYNKKHPISGNKIIKYEMKCHCGCGSLVKAEFMINNFNLLNNEIINAGSSDIFYTYCVHKNGFAYKQSSKQYFQNLMPYQEVQPYSGKTSLNKIENTYNACENAYIKNKYNDDVIICIFNYKHDDNAKKLLKHFSTFFNTVVLDSGNDKVIDEFIQFENIYYTGLINEVKKLIENTSYKWVGIICSDVIITYDNLLKISNTLKQLQNMTNIGQYQPSFSKDSYNWLNNIQNEELGLESKIFLDGPCIFIRRDIIDELNYINPNINKYGWGITRVTSLYSLNHGLLNIFDNRVNIIHEANKTGYSNDLANQYLQLYFKEVGVENKIKKLMNIARKNNSKGSVNIKI